MPRPLALLPCPTGPAVLDAVLPALGAALNGSGPARVLVPEGPYGAAVEAMARIGEPLESDDVALVVPTSGSTGQPKGALLSAGALTASATASLEWLDGPGSWLLALPVTHVAGLQVLIRSLLTDTVPEVLDLSGGFTAEAFVAATERLASAARRFTALVPTQLVRLLDSGGEALDALTAYDAVLVGGAATPADLVRAAREAGVRVVTTYGMTETCGGCVYDGVPLGGVEVLVDVDGRVLVAGPVLFSGYRGRPDLTAAVLGEDGWLVTGDLGRFDESGRLVWLARADDVVVSGGEKVSPGAVEAALAGAPGVREVAVLGEPDRVWGESVVAVVVPADPAAPPTLEALHAAGALTLPGYALPRRLVLVDALPLLASGKPDRVALRELAARAS